MRKLLPEEKYNLAYRNPDYLKGSVGMRYLTWTLHSVKFDSVLDVGCGCGYALCGFLLHNKRAEGMEVCDYLLDTMLRTYVVWERVKKGRIQQLPYAMDSFDLIYCTDVLEHIPEPDVSKSIGELVRVSKKYIFVTICTVPSRCMPALKLHETVKPRGWWEEQFDRYRVRKVKTQPTTEKEGVAILYEKY